MRLTEFFDLAEDTPPPDKPPEKGLAGVMSVSKKPRGPGKPGSGELPLTKKQQLWQMTQDFLSQHDPKRTGIPKKPSRGRGASGPGGSQQPAGLSPSDRPKYKGSFVGQTVDMGGQYKRKPVSWTDKETGERKYGGVQSKVTQKAVWDGQDWVSPEEFRSSIGKKR